MRVNLISVVSCVAAMAGMSPADIVLSNQPMVQAGGTLLDDPGEFRVVGFEIPPGPSWFLEAIEIPMSFGVGSGPAMVSLWRGDDTPHTQIGVAETTQAQMGASLFVWNVPGFVVLEPGETYWMRVEPFLASSSFIWAGSALGPEPGGVFHFAGYRDHLTVGSRIRNEVRIRALPLLISNAQATTGLGNLLVPPSEKTAGLTMPRTQEFWLQDVSVMMQSSGGQPAVELLRGVSPDESMGTATGNVLQGEAFQAFRFSGARLVLGLGERWWLRVDSANAASVRWQATAPSIEPTGVATSAGFFLNGLANSIRNKYFVTASPILGWNFDAPTSAFRVEPGEKLAAIVELHSGREAIIHGAAVQLDSALDRDDWIVELWSGTSAGPEQIVEPFLESEVADQASGQIRYALRESISLQTGISYWLVMTHDGPGDEFVEVISDRAAPLQGVVGGERLLLDGGEVSGTVLALAVLGVATNLCEPDVTGSADPGDAAYGVPDGIVDASDFFYFLDKFATGDLDAADLTASSDPASADYGVPDGAVDAADFFFYLDLFVAGCP